VVLLIYSADKIINKSAAHRPLNGILIGVRACLIPHVKGEKRTIFGRREKIVPTTTKGGVAASETKRNWDINF
jgi:hypothetical protein